MCDNNQIPLKFNDECSELIILFTKEHIKYSEIKKISIVNEDANFKGKSEPFSHLVLGGVSFFTFFGGPEVYVGLKLILNDGSYRPVYISKEKRGMYTDLFREDTKKAEKIKKMIDRRIIK